MKRRVFALVSRAPVPSVLRRRSISHAISRRISPPRPPIADPQRVAELSATPDDETFITGNGIAARCRNVVNWDVLHVNENVPNDWWFCKSDYLEFFFTRHAPRDPFVLFSHNGDRGIGNAFRKELERDRLVAWFAQNPLIEHPKLRALPIGIANPYWPHGDQRILCAVRAKRLPKSVLFDVSFNPATNPAVREYCIEQTGLQPAPTRPFGEYLEGLASSYFCLSPEGNGIDSQRTWEALYLRTIPVVTRNLVTDQHSDLPMIVVDDWADFREVDFSPSLYEETWGVFDPAELRLDRYFTRIEEAIRRLSASTR
jgi:hypothetical protein